MFHILCLGITLFFGLTAQAARWPFSPDTPVNIMNTISSYQLYGTQPGFHHGLDIAAPAGQPVYAPVSGRLEARYYYPPHPNDYTFEISVTEATGRRWELHHIDKSTIPPEILRQTEERSTIAEGTYLGRVFDAAVYRLEPHLHINLLQNGYHISPWAHLPARRDSIAPEVRRIFLLREDTLQEIDRQNILNVSPDSQIILETFDGFDESRFQLPPFQLNVFVAGESVFHRSFARLPYEDFLQGVGEVYLSEKFRLPNGEILEQATSGDERFYLLRIDLKTAVEKAPAGELILHVRDLAGNHTSYRIGYRNDSP